jgi:hypothetical protein
MLESNKLMRVHVYETWDYSGVAVETDEMAPQWYLESDIPYTKMWADDKHWLPYLLQNKAFIGRWELFININIYTYIISLSSIIMHYVRLTYVLVFDLMLIIIYRFEYEDEDTILDFDVREHAM